MKKIGFMSLVLMLGFLISFPAQAAPVVNTGTYTTAGVWEEKFFGCAPDHFLSVFSAAGQGFNLRRALLESVVQSDDPAWDWKSTYYCGTLILNTGGPWLKRGKLISRNVTVTIYSKMDDDNNLHFQMNAKGTFEGVSYSFEITAAFDGTAENFHVNYDEDGYPELQTGSKLDMVIKIISNARRPT